MLTGILLLGIIAFVGIISYKRPRLEQRILKKVPLIDWVNLLVFPIVIYYALVLIVENIISRGKVDILDFDDLQIIAIGLLFMVYAFVGNSIHFVGKVLSRYMPRSHHSITYQVNEIFHGKLSHYLVIVSSILLLFMLVILEINHPLNLLLASSNYYLVIIAGLLFGVSTAKTIFYTSGWFGGYNKPLFFIVSMLFLMQLMIYKTYKLLIFFYPFNLFYMSLSISFLATFLFRQFLIFSRLGKKRRLQFLAKILSA